jgi:hypothetical protein
MRYTSFKMKDLYTFPLTLNTPRVYFVVHCISAYIYAIFLSMALLKMKNSADKTLFQVRCHSLMDMEPKKSPHFQLLSVK